MYHVYRFHGTRYERYLGVWTLGPCHFPTHGLTFVPVV